MQQEPIFEQLKKLVTNSPVLKFYDVSDDITIQCDASVKGLGATLLQKGQPVAFASCVLNKMEQTYAQIEQECMAILFACERFKQYLATQVRYHNREHRLQATGTSFHQIYFQSSKMAPKNNIEIAKI